MVNLPLTTPRRSALFDVMLAWHRYSVLAEAEMIAAAQPRDRRAQERLERRRQRYQQLPADVRERVEGWARR